MNQKLLGTYLIGRGVSQNGNDLAYCDFFYTTFYDQE